MLAFPARLVAQDENSGNVQDRVQGLAVGDDGSIYCAGYSREELLERACV